MSGIWLLDCSKLAINWKNDNDVTISDMTSPSNFFDVVFFLLWVLVTGLSFMSISSLFLELWQFSVIRDWPDIWKSEIPPSEFCPISGDWDKLRIPDLAWMSLITCYWMLQNARATVFTVSFYRFWVIKGIKGKPTRRGGRGGGCKISPHQIEVKG